MYGVGGQVGVSLALAHNEINTPARSITVALIVTILYLPYCCLPVMP
ncbi:hypothetical protein BAZMOX_84593_2 [methanotrophic endosymbiont of Bathymodiolus azoricus (Menez Gwen)]|nr:hypothetical protein BAZMOX_84593_2 [methanotrophic endosymbiont of Bathymodiolus azoricus (Menez Gwen)]